MKNPKNMTAAELRHLEKRVEQLQRDRRLEERVEAELPGRARFPRLDGEQEWLETLKKNCGNPRCKKGCGPGNPKHGPYWYVYRPAPERKAGVTSHHIGRELPADLAAAYNLPEKLDASQAHQYSRQVREAEIMQAEADVMASEEEAAETAGAEYGAEAYPAPAAAPGREERKEEAAEAIR